MRTELIIFGILIGGLALGLFYTLITALDEYGTLNDESGKEKPKSLPREPGKKKVA